MNKEPGYRPYCLMCSTMGRMTITSYGFKCEGQGDLFVRPGCGNEITHEGVRHPGSRGPDPLMLEVQKLIMSRPVSLSALMALSHDTPDAKKADKTRNRERS